MDAVLLVATGPMAIEYHKVLTALDVPVVTVGRGAESAGRFSAATGYEPVLGLDGVLARKRRFETAIVAVNVDQLATVAGQLMTQGTRKILLEKPGGLNLAEVTDLESTRRRLSSQVWLGYNRRFYASTTEANRLISEDGGLLSFTFEFTEWSHVVANLPLSDDVKGTWVLANSSHVLDLAFFFGGIPAELSTWSVGSLPWHASARFVGAGVTNTAVPFSYSADWEAPGRWGIELETRARRLILRPLEELKQVAKGSLDLVSVPVDRSSDLDFKPGLLEEVRAFLTGTDARLCTLTEQCDRVAVYSRIAGYPE